MDKQELLSILAQYVKRGEITPSEISSITGVSPTTTQIVSSVPQKNKLFTVTGILYTIGGVILVVGMATLLFRFWDDLGSGVRILLTLGIGIAAYVSAISLRGNRPTQGITIIMEVLSGIVIPIGSFILIYEIGIKDITIGWGASVLSILAAFFIMSMVLFRSAVFSFFSVILTTAALYSTVGYVLEKAPSDTIADAFKYLTLAVGAGYLILSSSLKKTSFHVLTGFLNTFGIAGFLGALLVLGDFKPNQSGFWEFIGVLALIGGLYLARQTQSPSILRTTSLFIFIYIIKFTAEYFADSMGWPIALMFGGIILIGAGYGLVVFNKSSLKKIE
jgi:hypothetical protein